MNNRLLVPFVLIPLLFIVFNTIYKHFPSIKKDNMVEEYLEHVITCESGYVIDLSPDEIKRL